MIIQCNNYQNAIARSVLSIEVIIDILRRVQNTHFDNNKPYHRLSPSFPRGVSSFVQVSRIVPQR